MDKNISPADYVNYINAMAQMLNIREKFTSPEAKMRCTAVAIDILNILDPPKPKAAVLQLAHNKESDNA